MNENYEIANRIRELRIKEGLTQKQLAEKANVSYHSINSYESGRRTPSGKVLVKLETLFGVTGGYLYGIEGEMNEKYYSKAN